MGGVLSGSRGERGGKDTTDRHPAARLTVKNLYGLDWWQRDVRIRMEAPDLFMLVCAEVEHPVMIDSTPCRYGGFRRWFLCLKCGRRCTVLHFVGGMFACRQCHKLVYASQSENARSRLFRRVDAIRARLGWKPGILSPNGAKPDRMHWRNYLGLRDELAKLTDLLFCKLGKWADKASAKD